MCPINIYIYDARQTISAPGYSVCGSECEHVLYMYACIYVVWSTRVRSLAALIDIEFVLAKIAMQIVLDGCHQATCAARTLASLRGPTVGRAHNFRAHTEETCAPVARSHGCANMDAKLYARRRPAPLAPSALPPARHRSGL